MAPTNSTPPNQFPYVQVDVCPESVGVILSVGVTSIWLGDATAREVARKLADALSRPFPICVSDVVPKKKRTG